VQLVVRTVLAQPGQLLTDSDPSLADLADLLVREHVVVREVPVHVSLLLPLPALVADRELLWVELLGAEVTDCAAGELAAVAVERVLPREHLLDREAPRVGGRHAHLSWSLSAQANPLAHVHHAAVAGHVARACECPLQAGGIHVADRPRDQQRAQLLGELLCVCREVLGPIEVLELLVHATVGASELALLLLRMRSSDPFRDCDLLWREVREEFGLGAAHVGSVLHQAPPHAQQRSLSRLRSPLARGARRVRAGCCSRRECIAPVRRAQAGTHSGSGGPGG
jgi:hypothetical protein